MYKVGEIVKSMETGGELAAIVTRATDDVMTGICADGSFMYHSSGELIERKVTPTGWRIENFAELLEDLTTGNYTKAAAFNHVMSTEAERLGIDKAVVISTEEYNALLRQERTLEFYKGYVEGLETALKLIRREGANVDE